MNFQAWVWVIVHLVSKHFLFMVHSFRISLPIDVYLWTVINSVPGMRMDYCIFGIKPFPFSQCTTLWFVLIILKIKWCWQINMKLEIFTSILSSKYRLPLISVALIQGWAMGGGAELTTACDFRYNKNCITSSISIISIHSDSVFP